MNHSFNTDVAKRVGVVPAILLENIAFWVFKNKAEDQNFHEDRYWTYASIDGLAKLFDYLSVSQIRTALDKLIKAGLLVSGTFNKLGYDRTKWYSLTKESLAFYASFVKIRKCICQNSQMDLSEMTNGFVKNDKPIPDINTDINTDSKKKEREKKEVASDSSFPKRKQRLPDNWVLPETGLSWALAQGLTHAEITYEVENFTDYWKSKGEVRADWLATWRNWIRRSKQYKQQSKETIHDKRKHTIDVLTGRNRSGNVIDIEDVRTVSTH